YAPPLDVEDGHRSRSVHPRRKIVVDRHSARGRIGSRAEFESERGFHFRSVSVTGARIEADVVTRQRATARERPARFRDSESLDLLRRETLRPVIHPDDAVRFERVAAQI